MNDTKQDETVVDVMLAEMEGHIRHHDINRDSLRRLAHSLLGIVRDDSPASAVGRAIPTPDEARAAWLVERTESLRDFVCERMRLDTPPYRLNVDAYPEEARLAVEQACKARGWGVAFEDVERTRPSLFGSGGDKYTVRVMKVWHP